MLNPKDGQRIVSGTANNEHFWSGNCQGIREELLRQACRSCDCYATDILILLERTGESMKMFLEAEGFAQIDIYFKQGGCNWAFFRQDGLVGNVGSLPLQYRAAMALRKEPHPSFPDESAFTLHRFPGNV